MVYSGYDISLTRKRVQVRILLGPSNKMPYKNKKDQLDWQNRKIHKYKKYLRTIKYKSGGCQLCGYNKHPEILQFHHREPALKSFNFADGNNGNKSIKIINKEIQKCILLCPNCHNWLHYKETAK